MNISAILAVRNGSSRLPNKPCLSLGKKTVLDYLIERVKKSKYIGQIIVATTPRKEDRELIQIALNHDCSVYVGSENNVSERVIEAAELYGVDIIVRITQDCPLIDPVIIDKTIRLLINGGFHFAASRLNPDAYPDGMDVDVFYRKAFTTCWMLDDGAHAPEHISEPMKVNNAIHKGALPLTEYGPLGGIRLTLDTKEDYAVIKNIVNFYQDGNFGYVDILRDFRGSWLHKTMATFDDAEWREE